MENLNCSNCGASLKNGCIHCDHCDHVNTWASPVDMSQYRDEDEGGGIN